MDHRIVLDQVAESYGAASDKYFGHWVAMYQSNEPLPKALEGSPQVSMGEDFDWGLTYVAPTLEEAIRQVNNDLSKLGIDPPEPERAEPLED